MRPISSDGSRTAGVVRGGRTVFDLGLAVAAVPLVRRIVSDIVRIKSQLLEKKLEIVRASADGSRARTRERFLLEDEARELRRSLREVIDELHSMGAVLLHPVHGEVGFPTIVNGSLAYLVYRNETDGIEFWRYRDQARLRPIPAHWSATTNLSSEIEEEGLLV